MTGVIMRGGWLKQNQIDWGGAGNEKLHFGDETGPIEHFGYRY